MSEPIHVAITRRIKPGCEAAFQSALRDFFPPSFAHPGVQGASMIVPSPGSKSPEFGILRTFAGEMERDEFYASPLFKAFAEKVEPLTEGGPVHRNLTGLEAWFRRPNPPPLWKMAIATYLGVLPTVVVLALTLGTVIRQWNFYLSNIVFNAAVVISLTWVVMPFITRILRRWLN